MTEKNCVMSFYSSISLLRTGLFITVAITLQKIASSHTNEVKGCVFTHESCPCSQTEPSGLCMRQDYKGLCLLDKCSTGYRCDCFGYSLCMRKKCAVYTAMENVIPSDRIPFGCHLTSDAGDCTSFSRMLDTIDAASNALAEASHSNDMASSYTSESFQIVAMVQQDIVAVNEALKSIEPFRDELSDQETNDIERDVEIVRRCAADVAREALEVDLKACEVNKQRRMVADLKKSAHITDKKVKRAQHKLKEAEEKAGKERKKCADCRELKDEIEKETLFRKESCSKAGEVAKRARDERLNAYEGRKQVIGNRSRSAEVRSRIERKIMTLAKRRYGVSKG